jgi:UDP-glucose 4-epimerase
MKVLVTGSEGLVGKMVCSTLAEQGHSFVGFDVATSGDILEFRALKEAAQSCDAIVHSAALLGFPGQTPGQIMEINLQGTWNVLSCALANDIHRVVFLSSVDVLGVFKGERAPDFLPLDESHDCYPRTPYAISKYLAEEMCEVFASAHNIDIVCLRPPGVWEAPATYEWIATERKKRAAFEWDPFWEYGAFIDVRDLAQACLSSLQAIFSGCHSVFVSSNDITTSGQTSFDLSHKLHPNIEWRGKTEFVENPYRTLLSNDAAKKLLNWEPMHLWSHFAKG